MRSALRDRLRREASAAGVSGRWQTISLCLDEDAREYFNVGVLFSHSGGVEVRMLDHFERLRCLFDSRVDPNDLARALSDIEATVFKLTQKGITVPSELGESVRLTSPLYAAGDSPEAVVDEFYSDVVTLGRPKRSRDYVFRYHSTPKLRQTVFDHMREKMQLQASRIIQEERFRLKLRSGHSIDIDIPLLSSNASGTVISAWYKSPLVVENALLQASSDINLIRSNSEHHREAAISVLMPGEGSGLSKAELNKLDAVTHKQLDRFRLAGIEVIESDTTLGLADLTVNWWREHAA